MNIDYPVALPNSDENNSDSFIEDKKQRIKFNNARYYGHENNIGFYPIGRLNTWHGGIHIEGEKKAVRALADGRIIAYKVLDKYHSVKNEPSLKYSSGFVLLQHDYQYSKARSFRFYSLYMHLMPKSVMTETKKIPDIFATYYGKVSGNECEMGLIARSGNVLENSKGNAKGKEICFIPYGAIVTLDEFIQVAKCEFSNESIHKMNRSHENYCNKDTYVHIPDDHWSKKHLQYKRVKYKDVTDIYIYIGKSSVRSLGNDKYKIIYKKDSVKKLKKNAPEGAVVYSGKDKRGDRKYLRTEKKGVDLGELIKISDKWFQLKGKDEYVSANAIVVTKSFRPDILLDKIVNVDIEISSGTTLGYSGLYAFKNQPSYNAFHLEVFSDDKELNKFINNKDDITILEYEVPKDKILYERHSVSEFIKGCKVKVFQIQDDFAEIGFENIYRIIDAKYLTNLALNKTTRIKKKFIDKVNQGVEYEFTTENKFKVVAYSDEKGNIKKSASSHRIIELKFKNTNKKYWIPSDLISYKGMLKVNDSYEVFKIEQDSNLEILYDSSLGETMQDQEKINVSLITNKKPSGKKEDSMVFPSWCQLSQDVEWCYNEKPTPDILNGERLDEILDVDTILQRKTTKEGKVWCKVTGVTFKGTKKIIKKGWVNKSDLRKINPSDWLSVGWKIYENTGDQYIYQFDTNKKETPHPFIQQIWDEIEKQPIYERDKDGGLKEIKRDRVLNQFELQNAFRYEKTVNSLSKLICKHVSEWDHFQNKASLRKEIETLFQKGIDSEADSESKQNLMDIRDERIIQLEDKMEKLSFWDKITNESVSETNDNLPDRTFPRDSNVYHFHPIAFVDQMLRILKKKDIDLSDPQKWISQFSLPKPRVACFRACTKILNKYNILEAPLGNPMSKRYANNTPYFSNVIQVVIQYDDGTLHGTGREQEGIDYMDSQLEKGYPVLVGVDDGRIKKHNVDNSTEHFIVITGRLTDNKGLYYRFFEVGTYDRNRETKGYCPHNKLYLGENKFIRGKNFKINSKKIYTINQIRKNIIL